MSGEETGSPVESPIIAKRVLLLGELSLADGRLAAHILFILLKIEAIESVQKLLESLDVFFGILVVGTLIKDVHEIDFGGLAFLVERQIVFIAALSGF